MGTSAGSFHPKAAGSRNSGERGTFAMASVAGAPCGGWESSTVSASTCRPRTGRFGAGVGPLRA